MSEEFSFAPWLPNDPDLIPFYKGISGFVKEHLHPISGMSKSNLSSITGKSFADPLLGYIHIRPWERAFVETKLFQRLRRIRQVGLAYLVYPTLGYSRFEHTLGVLGRLDEITTRLGQVHASAKTRDPEIVQLIHDFEIPIRLAA